MESYEKNEFNYLPGEPGNLVYLLKNGRVEISRVSGEGQEATMCILEPGEIFGEVEVMGGVSRETVGSLVSQFQHQGLILQEHRHILLMDPKRLSQVK